MSRHMDIVPTPISRSSSISAPGWNRFSRPFGTVCPQRLQRNHRAPGIQRNDDEESEADGERFVGILA